MVHIGYSAGARPRHDFWRRRPRAGLKSMLKIEVGDFGELRFFGRAASGLEWLAPAKMNPYLETYL